MTARIRSGPRDRLSCTAELRHFGIWRAAVSIAAGLALTASLAWAISSRQTVSPLLLATVLAGVAGVVALAMSLLRVEPGTLRSESGRWSFTAAAAPAVTNAGELAVAIDLGSFMLLSFRAAGKPRRWLPAQRRGLDADWHALRAAVHAPRPPAGDADAEAPGRALAE